MSEQPPSPITQLLVAAGQGDQAAHDRLWAAIYDELRRLAQHEVAGDNPGRRMQPTSLVHEAYLRLVGNDHVEWANRRHFFAAAAKAMRRIRIDDARKRNRLKRGGGRRQVPLDEQGVVGKGFPQGKVREGIHAPADSASDPAELLALDEALTRLEREDPRVAEVVDLRYFAGLTRQETAAALGCSPRQIDSDWQFARVWLHRQFSGE
jgi:RNA polymerase sigma factor (sigma-70 family)